MASREFRNLKELEKFVGSQEGTSELFDDREIKKLLTKEARRLEQLVRQELQKYMESYDPVEYTRTGYTAQSIKVGIPKKTGMNEWTIAITFRENLANHPSYVGQDQPDGYTPILLELGWVSRGLEKQIGQVDRFTRFEGSNFISKAVQKYNKKNPHGFMVKMFVDGKEYKGWGRYGKW